MPEGRLISAFSRCTPDAQASRWDNLWKSGEQDLWDRGQASPALREYLQSDNCLIKAVGEHCGRRRKALVPACGTGYDVMFLAKLGFDTVGLEVSAQAVDTARGYAASVSGVEGRTKDINWGKVDFVQGDFFSQDWESNVLSGTMGFDFVYDYTFLCALLPESRKAWADRMAELVKPGRYLVCLEFPLWKENQAEGPPFGLQGVYWNLLAEGGDGKVEREHMEDDSLTGSGQFTRVQRLKPSISFPQGKGTDMISVWKKK
ncbi:hypothetical protein WHR41_09496 [Cladosporium halotolerans]|uniref:S-adenosyl-L-methionine-dependent methyltransferase n=1 Tax=Cladosporium halotolerans TaxID=1052096 RepID=A0AB34KEK2_9PEZI